jgi:arsenite methyltransferase
MAGAAQPIKPVQDQWAQWLLDRRHGGDAEAYRRVLEALAPVRERVLDHAAVAEGAVVLDVGTGDGLLAFGALERVGQTGRVIFSDVSQDLLDHCRALAQEMGVLDRCAFLPASADDLAALDDGSVDAVTTRSVLIFVKAKDQAFREFYRVLKAGGRLSIFEPINRFGQVAPPHLLWGYAGYDVTPVLDLAERVRAVYERAQPAADNPMLDFDERDLFTLAERAGFTEVHLDLQARVAPLEPSSWEAFARSAPNPLAPTLEEAMREALAANERERFVDHLRPLVEAGAGTRRSAAAYLWAVKRS